MPARIVLGVGAGIAAYKACELLRLFTEAGHRVRVVPTEDSLRFVGAATWAALSGEPVATSAFADVHDVPHVRLGKEAEAPRAADAEPELLLSYFLQQLIYDVPDARRGPAASPCTPRPKPWTRFRCVSCFGPTSSAWCFGIRGLG